MGFDEWQRRLMPATCAVSERVAGRDFRGRTIAVRGHLVGDAVAVYGAFARAGARVVVSPCNPDSSVPEVLDDLRALGVAVHGRRGMNPAEDAEALAACADAADDIVTDMGGELILAAIRAGRRPKGALEATGTGILRLADGPAPPFPVFNWDDIALKDGLHNRFHVGATVWPAFEQITSMNLFGRRVLVIGHGPVGRGVAERARALGAVVTVAELDPVRRMEARHLGVALADDLDGALAGAEIVVTATGRPGILTAERLGRLSDGTILFNCGHGNREIDVDWLDGQGRRSVRPLIDGHDLAGGTVYLLNRGNLLNLAPGTAGFGRDLFDPFSALIVMALEWLLDGGADGVAPGLHPFPQELERRVADLALAGTTVRTHRHMH